MEARFALKFARPGQAPQNSAGRLSWEHTAGIDRILISSTIGYGLAELEVRPGLASLKTADGKTREAGNADVLLEEVTGQPLPVTRLPDWLRGRASAGAKLDNDSLGRPSHLDEGSWSIDYAYDNDASDAAASHLTLRYNSDIELRLRIEEWKTNP